MPRIASDWGVISMNLPPAAVVVIIVIAALANVLIFVAAVTRARVQRSSQRFAAVEGYVSSSYRHDDGDAMSSASGDTWLPGDIERSSSQPHSLDPDGWPRPAWPGTSGLITGGTETYQPPIEPFELPEPTLLEQRAGVSADVADADETSVDDERMDELEEDEATMQADGEAVTDEDVQADDADATGTSAGAEDDESTGAEVLPADGPAVAQGGRDPLTGMLDAVAFDEVMDHEDARQQRYGRPATVIVFELDGLAKLVDRLGAEPGDRIETALGDTIRRLARGADHVARLERGRYAVLLPETDEVAAINYVERIRRACDLWLESGAIAMRLAIGWASTSGDAGLSGAVRAATDRMRFEQRRNARGPGDVALDVEGRDGYGSMEAPAGV
jgi:diguanylate cyclase (GGDEF)-like protein